MKDPELISIWKSRIQEAASCDTTIKSWCARNGFSLNQYYYWNNRLRTVDTSISLDSATTVEPGQAERPNRKPGSPPSKNGNRPSDTSTNWIQLSSSSVPSPSHHLIVRISGAEIDIRHGFDSDLLRSIVAALGCQPC